MKVRCFVFIALLLGTVSSLSAAPFYAEQYYKLYHSHLIATEDDLMEAIGYLQMCLKSDLANPLNALARIEDETEWEKYKYLFYMHVNLLLVENHLLLARKFDKHKAYFYNYPWKYVNIDSLNTAQRLYEMAYPYWEEALKWAEKAREDRFYWIDLEEIQYWQDELFRIEIGDLDYRAIIDHELERVEKVRQDFLAMNEDTY